MRSSRAVASRADLPAGLHVTERAPSSGWDGYEGPIVVLVHGSLDRSSSFDRTAMRLRDWGLVAYDRRGYQGSRTMGVGSGVAIHAEDLSAVATAYSRPGGRLTAIGHSVGGTVVLAAAVAHAELFSSIGVYEPSMPWLGFHRPPAVGSPTSDPEPDGRSTRSCDRDRPRTTDVEVERFFRRMAGDAAWERLGDRGRGSRLADGPALVADLRAIRHGTPFDATRLRVPALVACGEKGFEHHRRTVDWLAEHVGAARALRIPGAGHGAHLSHPDAFARFVRLAVALADDAAAT